MPSPEQQVASYLARHQLGVELGDTAKVRGVITLTNLVNNNRRFFFPFAPPLVIMPYTPVTKGLVCHLQITSALHSLARLAASEDCKAALANPAVLQSAVHCLEAPGKARHVWLHDPCAHACRPMQWNVCAACTC